jgi:hypothetical protein
MLRGNVSRVSRLCLVVCPVLMLFSTVSDSARGGRAMAQSSCTPPLYQGYPSVCANIFLRWLNRDAISLIDRYEIYRGGLKVGQAPGNATSWSEPVGCSFSARYIIKQVMKSGASCSVETTGNPPHTKPCDLCTGGQAPLNLVSSASFTAPVAPGSIATVFAGEGQSLTSVTASANSFPLPTNISGTQVLVNDAPASLFYVSPGQINFLMPQTNAGAVRVVVAGSGGQRIEGPALTGPNPAIFVSNRVVAALTTADGAVYGRTVDGNGNPIPVSVGGAGNPTYLVLFGTGAHPQFAGLDQINVRLPESLRGVGLTGVTVSAGGFVANLAQLTIGN